MLVNIGTKDISKDIYPSLLLPLPSLALSVFSYSLNCSKTPHPVWPFNLRREAVVSLLLISAMIHHFCRSFLQVMIDR